MPAVFGAPTQKVNVQSDDNPENDAIFVFRGLDDPVMTKALETYMGKSVKRAAMRGRRGKIGEDTVKEQQDDFVEFFDETILDLENSVAPDSNGDLVPLNNKVEGWKDRVSRHYKVTAAGLVIQRPAYFGETEAEVVGN